MTIRECYKKLGGDYDEVFGRLQNEKLISRVLVKFISDKSCETLISSIETANFEEAFRAAHTLKGICMNLNLGKLYKSCAELTELLRNFNSVKAEDTVKLVEQMKVDYEDTIAAINEFNS